MTADADKPDWRKRWEAFRTAHREGSSHHWRSRGYLPHFDGSGIVQAVTFRLFDALPASVLSKWEKELAALPEKDREMQLSARIADYLDAGHGRCWLRRPEIAGIVEDTLLFFDGERYRLLAWCIMPNHVHVVFDMLKDGSLPEILKSWKGFSAREANLVLGRSGTFWQREYFDRFVRDGPHFENAVRYVEANPVKAGLATKPEDWPFSSARHPRRLPSLPLQ